MIEFISVGQRAEGIIAIGQEATGFIAIGQVATGVFALGQMARGVFAVGQLAIGVFAVGMLSVGLSGSVGMIGAGARGLGGILPIVPGPHRKPKLPAAGNPQAIREGREIGWLPVKISGSAPNVVIAHTSGSIAATIAPACNEAVATAANEANVPAVYALFGPGPGGKPELRRLMRMFDPWATFGTTRWVISAGQLVALAIACAVYCEFVVVPLGDFLLVALRSIVTGQ
jgi:hypothetical protein